MNNNFSAPIGKAVPGSVIQLTEADKRPLPVMEVTHSANNQVGDINSNAIGSGARFNAGKPDYSLMVLADLPIPDDVDIDLELAFKCLGKFQLSGESDHLKEALRLMYHYAEREAKTDYVFESVVRVWEFGEQKYNRWNWAQGMDWSVPIACAARHFLAIVEKYEEIDEDSDQPHWAHLVCNLQMLLLYTRSYQEGNDLPYKAYEKPKTSFTIPISNMEWGIDEAFE